MVTNKNGIVSCFFQLNLSAEFVWSQVTKYNLALRADSTKYLSTSPRPFSFLGENENMSPASQQIRTQRRLRTIEKSRQYLLAALFNICCDPTENRTPIPGMRILCTSRYTIGPYNFCSVRTIVAKISENSTLFGCFRFEAKKGGKPTYNRQINAKTFTHSYY